MFSFVNFYFSTVYNQSFFDFILNREKLTIEEMRWLKEQEPFIYAADNNAPPLRFLNKETGQYEGVVVDYINELSIELGVNITVKPLVWDQALKSLEKGASDFCDMFPSEKREERFIFTDPIYFENGVLVTRKGSNDISDISDLEGKTIAIQKGDFIEEFLRERVENITYFYTNDYQESLYLLSDGVVDATGGDEPVLSYFISNYDFNESLEIQSDPIYEMPVILALPKDHTMLRDITNKGIKALKKKNTMIRIQQKWFGISRPITQDNSEEIIKMFLEVLLLIFVLGFIIIYYWNRELNERIRKGIHKSNVAKRDIQIIFDSLPYFFIIIDNQYRILEVNEPFVQYIGQAKEDIIGTNIFGYPIFDMISKVEIDEGITKKETLMEGQFYDISSVSLATASEKKRKLIIVENVTRERLREEQLMHSNKIAALGQLAAGVTHEIRNPLGLIRNFTYIIKNKLYNNEEEFLENIKGIDDALDSVNQFINNLLNFSRISSKEKEVIYLKDFFDEVLRLSNRNLEKKGIKVSLKCDESYTYFNRESLKHIFFNLISNAIDAITDSGTIDIVVQQLDAFVIITFSDNGKGIKKENIDHIFEPFFTTKYPSQGTGLGLNIVYKEITENNGEISVRSEYLKGTTFTIKLPIEGKFNE